MHDNRNYLPINVNPDPVETALAFVDAGQDEGARWYASLNIPRSGFDLPHESYDQAAARILAAEVRRLRTLCAQTLIP
jgi:hypothetical protein